MSEVLKRIESGENIGSLLPDVIGVHDIGELTTWKALEVGLEDCNIKVETDKGKYLVKIFSSSRDRSEVTRYIDILEHISGNPDITTQQLVKTSDGNSSGFLSGDVDPYVLLTWLEGTPFYDQKRVATDTELADLISQVAALHYIDYHPEFMFDSWEVGNIRGKYRDAQKYLNEEEVMLAKEAIRRFDAINRDGLPHAFVHGDFTKQNVLAMGNNKVGVIDFAVANWYPRIQDLAVIIANFMFDEGILVDEACQKVTKLYERHIKLTDEERKVLGDYAIAAMAMEFLGGIVEKHEKGSDLKEINYWIELGRKSLKANLL